MSDFSLDHKFPQLADVLTGTCSAAFEVGERAMARNLLCDHRIPEARLRSVFANVELNNIRDVQKAIVLHKKREVCPPKQGGAGGESVPAYARSENRENAVELPLDMTVATVLNLSWLGKVYAAARVPFRMPEFQRFELVDPRDASEVNAILSDELNAAGNRRPFLAAILRAMGRFRRSTLETHIGITWVAEWNSVKDFLVPDRPERWLQAVGVFTDTPAWVAVLRYRIRIARQRLALFRPTQLDSGWYAHHFPSPPQAALPVGGHTMFLGNGRGDPEPSGLVSEYIHQRTDFRIEDWALGGELLGFVDSPQGGSLARQRDRHLALLSRQYGAGVQTWMAESL